MADDGGSGDGLMSRIGDALASPEFLKTRMAFGIVVGIASTWLFTYILLQMERQTTSYNAAVMEAAVGERDTQLELEEDTQASSTQSNYVQATDDDDDMTVKSNSPKADAKTTFGDALYKLGDTRRRLLSTQQHVQIIAHVLIVILFNYLLLVFLPGSIWLSFVAIVIVWVLALQSYLRDELGRRRRYDRIITMMALFSIIAGCLTLVTFCHLALKEGDIYEGPARITGYDSSAYANNDGTTMRADLQVSWGGMWGCPDVGGKQCTATVQGALCETKYDVSDNNNNRRRRAKSDNVVVEVQEYQVEQMEGDINGSAKKEMMNQTMSPQEEEEEEEVNEELEEEVEEEEEEVEGEEEEVEEEDEENQELNEELNTETAIHEEMEGELESEVDILVSNSTDPEEEEELTDLATGEAFEAGAEEGALEELENENEELKNELDAEKDLNGELEEELGEMEGGAIIYSYDDEIYEDDYWTQQDWDSIWGEYACEDLFSGDLDSVQGMNMNTAPGNDQWPTVNIYGSCNTCTAYILDYYSTEHFQNIRSYEYQSWLYLIFGLVLLIVAAIFAMMERVRPSKDKRSVLLSHEGGVLA